MGWQEQLDKAISAIKEAADSETARDMATKAKATATDLARKVKDGAVSAPDRFSRSAGPWRPEWDRGAPLRANVVQSERTLQRPRGHVAMK